MNGPRRALSERLYRLWRNRRHTDSSGLTLVELVVVMAVVLIVMTLSTMLIINVNQQTTNMLDTVHGVQQQTEANLALVQYLRGSSQLLAVYNGAGAQIGPSATELDVVVNDGFNTNSATNNYGIRNSYESNCTNVDAVWFPVAAGADAQFAVNYDMPGAGPPNSAPWSTISSDGAGPYKYTPASPCTISGASGVARTVNTYYAYAAQSMTTDPVFTYWGWSTNAVTTTTSTALPNIPPGLVQLPLVSNVIPACAVPNVAAIGIHVTFIAGPQAPRGAFAGDQPTTLNTLVFLKGSSTSGATTSTTTTSTTVACPD